MVYFNRTKGMVDITRGTRFSLTSSISGLIEVFPCNVLACSV
jgi:hypothetical protein